MKVILTVEDVIRQAASADAYRDIHPDVIRRVCENEALKGLKSRELVKSIRSRLHQIGGAYLPASLNLDAFGIELAALSRGRNDAQMQAFCRKKMELHASTRERLPILERFFQEVLADLPPIQSVLDLACGLTPLSIAWMPLQNSTTYTAVDMYRGLAVTLQQFFDHTQVNGKAVAGDVITYPLETLADVALLLKTLPCLEQQEKGSSKLLVDRINAKTIVISYPLRTLGGNRKGLGATYEADFNQLAASRNWQHVKRFEFSNELVFRIEKP